MDTCLVKVPGKVMLAGEYSVLVNQTALACAVNCYLEVELESSATPGIAIVSDLWQNQRRYVSQKDQVKGLPKEQQASFEAAFHACELAHIRPSHHIKIRSHYDPSYGFGSSSAVYLGVLKAFKHVYHLAYSAKVEARQLQKTKQQHASGYDIWTQDLGGLVQFEEEGAKKLHDASSDYFALYIGGKGASSSELIPKTFHWFDTNHRIEALAQHNEKICRALRHLLVEYSRSHEIKLFAAIKKQQQLVLNSPAKNELLENIENQPGCYDTWAAKTTGAGGQDAIILFGQADARVPGALFLQKAGLHKIDIAIDEQGAQIYAS